MSCAVARYPINRSERLIPVKIHASKQGEWSGYIISLDVIEMMSWSVRMVSLAEDTQFFVT